LGFGRHKVSPIGTRARTHPHAAAQLAITTENSHHGFGILAEQAETQRLSRCFTRPTSCSTEPPKRQRHDCGDGRDSW